MSSTTLRTPPTGHRSDTLATFLSGLIAVGLVSVAWVLLEQYDIVSSMWFAIPLGICAATGVQFGGDKGDSGYNLGLATALYVFFLLGSLLLINYLELKDIYINLTFKQFENSFINSKVENPLHLISYISGYVALLVTSKFLK